MHPRLGALATVIGLCAAACANASPTADPGSTTTVLTTVDRAATYLGLSVRLQVDAPVVEGDRTEVRAFFIIENRTARTISYGGCPFGNLAFGLLPAAHPDAPLTGYSETSCAGGVTSVKPGASDRYFAMTFTTRSSKIRLPPGGYIAVVRFADGTEVRKSTTLAA